MQLPHVNAGSQGYLDHTDFFEGAAEAWQDAEILTAEQTQGVQMALALVSAAGAQLRTATGVTEQASRIAAKARARFRVRDVILDLKVMGLSDALYNGLCGRNYGHPKYRFVFDDGTAGAVTSAKAREEPDIVQALLGRYDKVEDFNGKQAARDALAGAMTKSFGVRNDLDNAEKAENDAGTNEILARLEVRKALEKAHGILKTTFPGMKTFVESFFPKREKAAETTTKVEGAETSTIASAIPANGGASATAMPAAPAGETAKPA